MSDGKPSPCPARHKVGKTERRSPIAGSASPPRHCEERSDAAIQPLPAPSTGLLRKLAMTPPTRYSPLPTPHSPLATFHPPIPTLDTTTAPLPPELEQVHWKYPPFFHGTGAEWRCVGEGLACGQKAAKRRWTCRERVFISPHDRTVQAPSAIARVAQLVEQATENRCVGGSIPPSGTTHFLQ